MKRAPHYKQSAFILKTSNSTTNAFYNDYEKGGDVVKWLYRRLKFWYRWRTIDRRIKARVVAEGKWDSLSELNGRALEIKAREDYGLKRKEGETDNELRKRLTK